VAELGTELTVDDGAVDLEQEIGAAAHRIICCALVMQRPEVNLTIICGLVFYLWLGFSGRKFVIDIRMFPGIGPSRFHALPLGIG
jgi:hypothetical protein